MNLILRSFTNPVDSHLSQLYIQSMSSAMISGCSFNLSWSFASSGVSIDNGLLEITEKSWIIGKLYVKTSASNGHNPEHLIEMIFQLPKHF